MATNIAFDIIANDRASRTFNNVGQAADKSSHKLRSFAKVGALAVAAGAVVAGKALFDMTKSAIEDEKAQALLATQLRNSAKATDSQISSTEKWISAQGRALGVTDDELRPALGRLVAVTHDVGKAQKLTSLAMDVSAGTGKSLKTVTEALAKAQTGNVGGLSRLGVATKDASGKTLALDTITKNLAKTYEGQAATAANTTEGKFGRLKLMLDETKESIGAKLIPVVTELADWFLRDGVPALQKFGDWIDQKILPTLQDLGNWIGDKVLPVLEEFGGFIVDHVIPALQELGEGALAGVKGFIDNVGAAIEDNRPFIDALLEGFRKVATLLVDTLGPVLGKLYETFLPLLGDAIGKTIGVIRTLVSGFLKMGEWGVRAFGYLLDAAMGAFEGILDAAAWGLGWIPGIGDKIRNARDAFAEFRDDTVRQLEAVANKLQDVHDRINGIHSKDIRIGVTVDYSTEGALNALTGPLGVDRFGDPLSGKGGNALGTGYWRGGRTLVGESGPEIVDLPRGSRIYDNARSQAMARESGGGINYRELGRAIVAAMREGAPLVQLRDAGQGAYVSGAAF